MKFSNHWTRWLWLGLALAFLLKSLWMPEGMLKSLGNFSPMMAIALVGAFLWVKSGKGGGNGKLWAVLGVVGLLLLSDLLNGHALGHGVVVLKYALFALMAWWGSVLARGQELPSLLGMLLRVVGGGVAFYVLGNTFAWLGSPSYPQSLAGWWQSNTVGLPGFPPSWLFLRNALVGDALFSVALLLAFNWERARLQLPRLGLVFGGRGKLEKLGKRAVA